MPHPIQNLPQNTSPTLFSAFQSMNLPVIPIRPGLKSTGPYNPHHPSNIYAILSFFKIITNATQLLHPGNGEDHGTRLLPARSGGCHGLPGLRTGAGIRSPWCTQCTHFGILWDCWYRGIPRGCPDSRSPACRRGFDHLTAIPPRPGGIPVMVITGRIQHPWHGQAERIRCGMSRP